MTLEEIKNISNEIKIRNLTSSNMIRHCFVYNPTREMIICLEKIGITYQYQNDSDAYSFARFRRPNDDMISYMNLNIDIQCDENGFVSYTIFSVISDAGIKEPRENLYYSHLKEGDIVGIINNDSFGYMNYECYSFYWSALDSSLIKNLMGFYPGVKGVGIKKSISQ